MNNMYALLYLIFQCLLATSRKQPVAQINSRRINVMLLGSSSAGKTCIAERMAKNLYRPGSMATIGADNYAIQTMVDGQEVEFLLWDTAGQERFAQLSMFYYRMADIAIVVYSVTCSESYNGAMAALQKILDVNMNNPQVILVGAKADQNETLVFGRPITEVAGQYCQDQNFCHLLVSAKEGTNMDILLDWVSQQALRILNAEARLMETQALEDVSADRRVRLEFETDEGYMDTSGSKQIVYLDDSCCEAD